MNYIDPTGYWASDGSDERFKENNPIVYAAIGDLTKTWEYLDKYKSDIGNMKKDVEKLTNKIREIGDDRIIPSTQVKFNDSTYKNLTSTEAVLFYYSPLQGAIVGVSSEAAIGFTISTYGHNNDSTIANAFQHSLWNALSIANGASMEYTKLFANAHEFGIPDNFADALALERTKMDLFNNEVGRYQGSLSRMDSRGFEAYLRIKERAENGGLLHLQ